MRLVELLNRYTRFDSRLVTFEDGLWPSSKTDLVFPRDLEQVYELAQSADIIHWHDGVHWEGHPFRPIDFRDLSRRGVQFLRQFHSHPSIITQSTGLSRRDLLDLSVASIVVAQYQERYYPDAYVVPNAVPLDELRPSVVPGHGVFFAASTATPSWRARWHTKGYAETAAMLGQLRRHTDEPIRVLLERPYEETMRYRRASRIVVDELFTGSYHQSALEGAALGKSTLAYCDSRTERVLRVVTGSESLPFANVHFLSASEFLRGWLQEPEETRARGEYARRWMERHWSESAIADRYVTTYSHLLENGCVPSRQTDLSLRTHSERKAAIFVPDRVHRARADAFKRQTEWPQRLRIAVDFPLRAFATTAKRSTKTLSESLRAASSSLYQSDFRPREEITSAVLRFERTYPVENYTLDGLAVWPLVRLVACDQAYTQRNRPSDVVSRVRRLLPTASFGQRTEADNPDYAAGDPRRDTDAVMLTQPNRAVTIEGRVVHTLADPLWKLLDKRDRRLSVLETGSDHRKRALPPVRIEGRLADAYRTRVGELPALEEPEWFSDVKDWLARDLGQRWTWQFLTQLWWQTYVQSELFEHWFKANGCQLVFVDSWYIPSSMAACWAANRCGLLSVDFQHGAQGQGHYGYAGWTRAPSGGYSLMPRYFWTWGENDARALRRLNREILSPETAIVGGFPWLEEWRTQWREGSRRRSSDDELSILVTLQGAVGYPVALKRAIEASPPHWQWRIRLHLQMQENTDIQRSLRATRHPNLEWQGTSRIPLYEALIDSDVHVTHYSTCALEALAFGKPTVLLHPTGARIFSEYVDRGVMRVSPPGRLLETLSIKDLPDADSCLAAASSVFAPAGSSEKALDLLLKLARPAS